MNFLLKNNMTTRLTHRAARWLLGGCAGVGCLWLALSATAALPASWQHYQTFEVTAPGLVKLSLPAATLDAARSGLEDLRLYDEAGNEVPYCIERPVATGKRIQNAKSFSTSLNSSATVILLETGLAQPLDGVTLETPARGFIKPVRVEGSADGHTWQTIAQGRPIFRQADGVEQLYLPLPVGTWAWLRLTVDDQRMAALPFTGARLHAAVAEAVPMESQLVTIAERDENPGETRLTLSLGAANLEVTSVNLETDEPLFTRPVTLAVPQISEAAIREQTVGQGVIYRVALEGQPVSARLAVPLDRVVPTRELIVRIRNDDSPPLPVNAVRIERRPVYLVFLARQPGKLYLLTGNAACPAPRYDLAALGANLKSAAQLPMTLPALSDNPAFQAPETLAGVELSGAPLDTAAWKYRKPVSIARGGVQQLELDQEVLAAMNYGGADLRLMLGSNQVPYLVQQPSISRTLAPEVTLVNDPKKPHLSRWQLKLPRAGLPLNRLSCTAPTALFQRSLSLYEELTDSRGDKYRHSLGSAMWTQTPQRKVREWSMTLESAPQSDTVYLETDNGDNPAITLEKFTFAYPVTRLVFKARAGAALSLYYGNPAVSAPNYDLGLVAGELLSASKVSASLAAEQPLKPSARSASVPGSGSLIFWVVLAVVGVGLLVIISRLLPKTPIEPTDGFGGK
jgi:hypothetical protein